MTVAMKVSRFPNKTTSTGPCWRCATSRTRSCWGILRAISVTCFLRDLCGVCRLTEVLRADPFSSETATDTEVDGRADEKWTLFPSHLRRSRDIVVGRRRWGPLSRRADYGMGLR